jgi:23S rRNA pseudouridine1911/1915/1917 synthase
MTIMGSLTSFETGPQPTTRNSQLTTHNSQLVTYMTIMGSLTSFETGPQPTTTMTAEANDPILVFSKRVLYEDNHLIIINKHSSEIVQGDKTGDIPLSDIVKEYVRIKYKKPGDAFLGVVHRLDRPVSGAVIFARTSKGLARVNEMLKNHELKKLYWAVVRNYPPEAEGTLEHYLKKNEKQNKSYPVRPEIDGAKKAIMHYKLLGSGNHYHLLEIELHTGRHHQIRSQLSAIGCPVRGDLKYGYPRSNSNGSIHLHAREIDFIHPVSKEKVRVVAPTPEGDSLWECFEDMFRVKSLNC